MHSRILGMALSAVALLLSAAHAPAEDQYAKLVEETYGNRIAKARTTASDTDDMELVKEMLMAAEDVQNSERLRLALAKKVLSLALPLGSAEAVSAAQASAKIIDSIEPLNRVQRAQLNKELALKALDRAREDGGKLNEIRDKAVTAVDAYLDYIEAALGDQTEMKKLGPAFASVNRLISSYRIVDRQERSNELRKEWTNLQARLARLRTAQAQLESARKSNNADAVRTARRAIGNLYLTYDGDIPTAAEYLEGTGDPAEPTVLAAAAFLRNPKKLDKTKGLQTAEDLAALAKRVQEGSASTRVVKCAYDLCTALVAEDLGGVQQAKAKLLLAQLKKMAGDTEADRFKKDLIAAWGPIEGDIEVIKDNHIRLKYDFTSAAQGRDWTTESGKWAVVKGLLGCEAGSEGMSANKLLFKASEPLKVSFTASARYDITLRLNCQHGTTVSAYYGTFALYAYRVTAYVFGNYWYDYGAKLKRGAIYKFEIAYDGKGTFTYTINGRLLKSIAASSQAGLTAKNAALSVHLATRNAQNPPTAFDDITIEGTVLPKPPK